MDPIVKRRKYVEIDTPFQTRKELALKNQYHPLHVQHAPFFPVPALSCAPAHVSGTVRQCLRGPPRVPGMSRPVPQCTWLPRSRQQSQRCVHLSPQFHRCYEAG